MLIATFALGDMVTTLVMRNRLSADDKDMYHLTSTDNVTDKTYTKVYLHENEAVRAFCAAIVCDEPDLSSEAERLYADPAMKPFLA